VKKELRILMLEDVAADAALISRALRRGGLSFQAKRVETRAEFMRELRETPPDVILSDHGLPAFDGFAALAEAHERCPDTPFIFVTGSMGDEVAVHSLRCGASDYVLKVSLQNLAPAVQRALHLGEERKKRRQAEKELRESEERFRLLVEGVKDYAISMLDPEGRISSWNAGVAWIEGYQAHEILGKHFSCLYVPEDRESGRPQQALEVAGKEGRFEEEGLRVRRGGSPFWAHSVITPMLDESGRLRGFAQVTRDITERVLSQEAMRNSEERHRHLVNFCPDALLVLTGEKITFANAAAQRLLGAEAMEKMAGREIIDFIAPESQNAFLRQIREMAWAPAKPGSSGPAEQGPAFTEAALLRLDGRKVAVEIATTLLPGDGEGTIQLIAHDITERKAAAAALRHSEMRKAAIMETALDAIVSIDSRGVVQEWNHAAEKIFGYRRKEAEGRRFDALLVPLALRERYLPHLADYLMNGVGSLIGRPIELTARRANGEEFPIELAITQVSEDPPLYTAFMRDITERKRGEEALRRSEARKRAIMETALDAVISVDYRGTIIEWNHAAEKIFGYSQELAMGRNLAGLIFPKAEDEGRKTVRFWETSRTQIIGKRVEVTAIRANGAEFPIELAVARIPGESPAVFTAIVRDITERRRTLEALRKSKERFRLLVEGVEDYAIYMLDPHGLVTTWNAGAERIEGYRSVEIIGRKFSRLYTPEDLERGQPEQALAVATAEGRFQDERWQVRKDGTRYWASVVLTAMRDERGLLSGFSRIARDITKSKEAEDEIRRLNAELEQRVAERTSELQEALREMEAFSFSISHDLRSPLIHIAGFVEILENEIGSNLNDNTLHYMQTIRQAAARMIRMIDDLLAFSRMGRTEMIRARVSMEEIVNSVRQDLQPEEKGRQVAWTVHRLPEVLGDPFLLRQAVFNLLSNALKYTGGRPQARIEIGARTGENETVFFVRDNGVGFDMDYVGKLFGVFQRLHPASAFEGIGIGLANVRRIIQRHGGRTWAEGAPDEGATFYFSLPGASEPPRQKQPDEPATPAPPSEKQP
jgi:PAS domain S-box-containing protein